jgi:hypothetical protein
MPIDPKARLRLQLGSQYSPLIKFRSCFHAGLCQALEIELASHLDALGLPGTAEVEIVAEERQPMSVRWFVNARECHYSDEIPVAAWSFVRGALFGREGEQGWKDSMRSVALDDARTAEQLTAFFGLFAKAVLEQRPSVLLGPEQTQAYAGPILETGFQKDSTDLQAWLAPVLRGVLDMGLSIADEPELRRILNGGLARRRAPSDLEEDLIAELTPETVEIHANRELIKRFSLASDAEKLVPSMRERLFYELGIHYPRFRFVATDALPDCTFEFKLHAWPTMPRVGLAPDELLVNHTDERLKPLGTKKRRLVINPTNGSQCSVIKAADGTAAETAGLTKLNEQGYLILCLEEELRRRSARFVNVRTVERDLKELGYAFPDLVACAKEKLSLEQITRVLRNLASEEVSIGNLRAILENVLEFDYVRCDSAQLIILDDRMPTNRNPEVSWLQNPNTLAQFVRTRMKRYITHKQTRGVATLRVYVLDPEIEELLRTYQAQRAELPEVERDRVLAAIAKEVSNLPLSAPSPPILTTIDLRSLIHEVIQTRFPGLPVLCYQELSPDSKVQRLATIAL